jgi:hypothetical protein
MKLKIIFSGIFVIAILNYLYQDGYFTKNGSYTEQSKIKIDQKIMIKSIVKNSLSQINKPILTDDVQELAEALQPLNDEQLKLVWFDEFGCNKKLDQKSNLGDEFDCKSDYLVAKSYEEAVWMQRNGYPSRSHLRLLQDPVNLPKLIKLAKYHHYNPAMAILTMYYIDEVKLDKANSMALSFVAYSEQNETFPNRLYGIVQLAKGNLFFGLSSLKIAALLGDTEALIRFDQYITQYPWIAEKITDHAHLVLARKYGMPYGQYPYDERPKQQEVET